MGKLLKKHRTEPAVRVLISRSAADGSHWRLGRR